MAWSRKIAHYGVLVAVVVGLLTAPGFADEKMKQSAQGTVDRATKSFANLRDDPNMGWFRSNLKKARAVVLVPIQVRAGFIFGASGGEAVMLARDEKGGWSQPAFYGLGSGSFGLQIGAEVSELALMIMTQKGVDALLSAKVQLGADISVAVGPVGAGAAAATADVLSFARSKGLYGGVSVAGSVIGPQHKRNSAYYGQEVRPVDILVRHKVKNPGAAKLVAGVTALANAGK